VGDNDGNGDEARRVTLFFGNDRHSVERQHRSVAEMKHGERRRQNEQRLALNQITASARVASVLAFLHAAGSAIVDGIGRNHPHRDNGQNAENGGEPEHGGQPEYPTQYATENAI
jgi:hypothetical protein